MTGPAIAGRDYFMETLDADRNVLRRVQEGHVSIRLGGASAWIPDRRAGEVAIQVVAADGTRLAWAELTDTDPDHMRFHREEPCDCEPAAGGAR